MFLGEPAIYEAARTAFVTVGAFEAACDGCTEFAANILAVHALDVRGPELRVHSEFCVTAACDAMVRTPSLSVSGRLRAGRLVCDATQAGSADLMIAGPGSISVRAALISVDRLRIAALGDELFFHCDGPFEGTARDLLRFDGSYPLAARALAVRTAACEVSGDSKVNVLQDAQLALRRLLVAGELFVGARILLEPLLTSAGGAPEREMIVHGDGRLQSGAFLVRDFDVLKLRAQYGADRSRPDQDNDAMPIHWDHVLVRCQYLQATATAGRGTGIDLAAHVHADQDVRIQGNVVAISAGASLRGGHVNIHSAALRVDGAIAACDSVSVDLVDDGSVGYALVAGSLRADSALSICGRRVEFLPGAFATAPQIRIAAGSLTASGRSVLIAKEALLVRCENLELCQSSSVTAEDALFRVGEAATLAGTLRLAHCLFTARAVDFAATSLLHCSKGTSAFTAIELARVPDGCQVELLGGVAKFSGIRIEFAATVTGKRESFVCSLMASCRRFGWRAFARQPRRCLVRGSVQPSAAACRLH